MYSHQKKKALINHYYEYCWNGGNTELYLTKIRCLFEHFFGQFQTPFKLVINFYKSTQKDVASDPVCFHMSKMMYDPKFTYLHSSSKNIWLAFFFVDECKYLIDYQMQMYYYFNKINREHRWEGTRFWDARS